MSRSLNNPCAVCGCADIKPAFDKSGEVLICIRCGVGFLSESIKLKTDPQYYESADHYAETSTDSGYLERVRANARDVLMILKKYAGLPSSLLDVGAHTGAFVDEALRAGFNACGIEPNKRAAERAKALNLPVSLGKIEDVDKAGEFDIITLFHVLEHLDDPVSAIKTIRAALPSGGIFAAEVPNFDSYLARKDRAAWKYIAPEHLFYFSEKSLTELLEKQGFEVLSSYRRNGELGFLGIKKLSHYLWGPPLTRNRLVPKSGNRNSDGTRHDKFGARGLVRMFLRLLIRALRRQDHVLIIAKKK